MSDTINDLRADLDQLLTEQQQLEANIREARLAEDLNALRHLRERALILPDEVAIVRVRLARAEIEEIKSEVARLEEKRAPALEAIESTKAQLEEVKKIFFQHEQSFASASADYQSLMTGIASKRSELKEAERRLEMLTHDKESVRETKSNQVSEAEAAFQGFKAIYRNGAE